MKKLFLGICYLLFSQLVAAQDVAGKVTDALTGSPVVGATVELGNLAATITNEQGFFEFKKFRQGYHLIKITSIGYKLFEQNISTPSSDLEIRLERHNILMQPVEIKAIRASDNAPFTKTNLSKKEIEKLNLAQDLPFLLNQTPSVVINSDAGNGVGYTGIRVRGSDATRINVTLNGIPYNDAESQGTFFVDLPDIASSISSVQIQRGVGTSSNGAGAFGATINISTNEVNTSAYAELNNSFGSFNTWKHTLKAGTGLINDHFTFDARLSKISSDGYVDRAFSDLRSFYISGAYLTNKTALRLNVISGKEKTYQAWYGVSEIDLKTNRTINYAGMEKAGEPYDNETDNYRQDHYQLFINHQFSDHLMINTALFLSRGKGYYEQYKANQFFKDYNLPDFITASDTITQTDLIRQLWLDNYYYGQIFSVQHAKNKDQLTIGGGWNRYDGNHFGEIIWAKTGVPDKYRWYDLDAYKTDVNGYAKYQRKISSSLEAFADLQFRRVLYNINGFRNNPSLKVRNAYNFFNPKVGLSYSINGYHWYLSYSRANKEPNRDDFEAGQSQQPKPEELNDFEFGVERKNANYSYGATAYYMNYKNQLVLTGKINDVGAYTRTNIAKSNRIGIELQGGFRFASWLSSYGNLALSQTQIRDFIEYFDTYDEDGKYIGQNSINHGSHDIAFSPAIVGAATITIVPLKDFEINLLNKYVSRQYLDNTSNKSRSLDPYYVQDARIAYSLKKFLVKETNFVFQVNNIFNKKYEPNGYTFSYQYNGSFITENYYYPMAGRNFMAAVSVRL